MKKYFFKSLTILLLSLTLSSPLCILAGEEDTGSSLFEVSESTENDENTESSEPTEETNEPAPTRVDWGVFEEGSLWEFYDSGDLYLTLIGSVDLNYLDTTSTDVPWAAYLDRIFDTYVTVGDDEVFVIPKERDHNYEIASEIPATKEKAGEITYICSECKDVYKVITLYDGSQVPAEDTYQLTATIDGNSVTISFTTSTVTELQLFVGVEYNLVKLSKKYTPLVKLKSSKLIKLLKKLKLAGEEETGAGSYYETDLCTFRADEIGSDDLTISYDDGSEDVLHFTFVEEDSTVTEDEGQTDQSTDETDTDDTNKASEDRTTTGDTDNADTVITENSPTAAAKDAATTVSASTGSTTVSTGAAQTTTTVKSTKILPAKGSTLVVSGGLYKVTKKGKTLSFLRPVSKKCKVFSVPATVRYKGVTYKVTAIGKNAFKNCKKLTRLSVGTNVTSIGSKAFYGLSTLKTLKIYSKKLTKKSLGSRACKGLYKKVKVYLPKKYLSAYRKYLKKAGLPKKAVYKILS